MNPNTIREMEPHIRQKFHFSASSFSRIFGVTRITEEMLEFCVEWSCGEEQAPLDCLHNVDHYFRKLWIKKLKG